MSCELLFLLKVWQIHIHALFAWQLGTECVSTLLTNGVLDVQYCSMRGCFASNGRLEVLVRHLCYHRYCTILYLKSVEEKMVSTFIRSSWKIILLLWL
jgi:hypothetical protein